jgi:hypothetical protein
MRLTAKSITAELHQLGHEARLEGGGGYFYFLGLEPAAWLEPLETLSIECYFA